MKLKNYLFIFLFIAVIAIAINVSSHDVQARNLTWIGTTSDSTLATNWNPNYVPGTGGLDNVTFANAQPCTWSLTANITNITVSGYSSTITQASNMLIGSSGFYQTSGTVTFSTSYTTTDSGNFIKTGGTITNSVLRLIVHGNIKINSNSAITVNYMRIGAGWTVNELCQISTDPTDTTPIYLEANSVLNIASGQLCHDKIYGGSPPTYYLENYGTITGTGTFELYGYNKPVPSCKPGLINSLFLIDNVGGGSTSPVLSFASALTGTSSLTVNSADSTYLMTVNFAGFPVSCKSISIGNRGIVQSSLTDTINIGNLTVTANGQINTTNINTITLKNNWDSSLGSFIGSTKLIITGIGTIKLASIQSFYNIDLSISSSITLNSNIWVKNHIGLNGTITQSNYYCNDSANIPIPLNVYSGGTFNNIYLNGTGSSYTVFYLTPMPGFIYSKQTVNYKCTSTNITVYSVGSFVGFKGYTQTYPTHFEFYISYPVSSQNIIFQIVGLYSVGQYQISVNHNLNQLIQANYNGSSQFSIIGPWSTSTDISLDQNVSTTATSQNQTTLFYVWIILMFALLFISVYAMEWGIIAGLVWVIASLVTFISLNGIIGLLILAIGLLLMSFGLNEYLER